MLKRPMVMKEIFELVGLFPSICRLSVGDKTQAMDS